MISLKIHCQIYGQNFWDGVLERVAGYFSLEIEDLKSGSKVSSIAKARAVLC